MTPEESIEVREAAAAAEREDPAADARRWLIEEQAGTLCTTMARSGMSGFPYGSVVPYALTPEGRPFILIANIATHTANLRFDPRGALFVRQPGLAGDPQKGWRITVMGFWEPVPADDPAQPELAARYAERIPASESYLEMHDFAFWRMRAIQHVRYIGGFGKITWIPGDRCERDPLGAGLRSAAPGAVAHMNEDHAHNLVEMVRGQTGQAPASAEMVGLDRAGFLVRTSGPDGLVYFSFGREIDADSLRVAVIDVLARCRAAGR